MLVNSLTTFVYTWHDPPHSTTSKIQSNFQNHGMKCTYLPLTKWTMNITWSKIYLCNIYPSNYIQNKEKATASANSLTTSAYSLPHTTKLHQIHWNIKNQEMKCSYLKEETERKREMCSLFSDLYILKWLGDRARDFGWRRFALLQQSLVFFFNIYIFFWR